MRKGILFLMVGLVLVGVNSVSAQEYRDPSCEGIQYSRLQKRGDVYYDRSTNRPYSGKVCHRPGPGGWAQQFETRNGRLHGRYEGWYQESSGRRVAHYRDGVLHGEYEISDDGFSESGSYNNGQKHGVWVYDGDAIVRVVFYMNGAPHNVNDVIFNENRTVLLRYPPNRRGAYTIPDGVTSIGNYAFYDCQNLTSITIPNSVTSIGTMAFAGCTALTSVTIPNSVTAIGNGAFTNTGLTSLTIGNGLSSIDAFYGITNLTTITIGSGVTSISTPIFYGLANLESIEIAATNPAYSSVDGVLFNKNRTTLLLYPAGKRNREYTIPSNVTTIGEGAFRGNQNLTSITIPNSVTSIGNNAFSNTGLTSVTIPNNVRSIGNAFSDNRNLTSINIGNGITSIENSAFSNTGVTSITIPNSVSSIGERAFQGNQNLTSIIIPNNITSIGRSAFSNTGLTSITIPNSVTTIGEQAFQGNRNLVSVTIGSGVTSIGRGAFDGCSNLKVVISLNPTPPEFSGSSGWGWRQSRSPARVYVQPNSVNRYLGNSGWNTGFSGVSDINSIARLSALTVSRGTLSPRFHSDSLNYKLSMPRTDTAVTINATPTIPTATVTGDGLKILRAGENIFRINVTAFDITNTYTVTTSRSGLSALTVSRGNLSPRFHTDSLNYVVTLPHTDTSLSIEATPMISNARVSGAGVKSLRVGENVFRVSVVTANITKTYTITVTRTDSRAVMGTWSCGVETNRDAVMATLAGDGTLTISGVGAMGDFNLQTVPWAMSRSLIRNVIIQNGITSIGENAFSFCTGLSSVVIPNSVTSIGAEAFSTTDLTTVTIPGSVTTINDRAFFGCPRLTSINVTTDNANYISENGVLFNKNKTVLIRYPIGRQGAYVIPGTVTTIGNGAFSCNSMFHNSTNANCSGLTSITIPNSVTTIGDFAFFGNRNLTSVTIPNSVISIGSNAFNGCTALTSVIVSKPTPPALTLSQTQIQAYRAQLQAGRDIQIRQIETQIQTFEQNAHLRPEQRELYTDPLRRRREQILAQPIEQQVQAYMQQMITAQAPLLFQGINQANACLYVPRNSIDVYRATPGWSVFTCIRDIESAPTAR